MILLDLASLPPREGGGQVSELQWTMSNPIFRSLQRKWLSLDMGGRSKWVSNGRRFVFFSGRTRPVCSVFALVLVKLMRGMMRSIRDCPCVTPFVVKLGVEITS